MLKNYNSITYLIRLIIRRSFIFLIIMPSSITFLLLVLVYKFQFHDFAKDYYQYISDVSQVPAESPKHVNIIKCLDSKQPIDNVEKVENYTCQKQQVVSVLIEDAATSAANDLKNLYWVLVIMSGILFLMISFLKDFSARKNQNSNPRVLGDAQRREI